MAHAAVPTQLLDGEHSDLEVVGPVVPVATPSLETGTDAGEHATTYRRSPLFLGRLVYLSGAFLTVAASIVLLDLTSHGARADVRQLADRLPSGLGPFLDAVALTMAIVIVGVAVTEQIVRRRLRFAGSVLAGATLAFVAAVALAFAVHGDALGSDDSARLLLGALAAGAATLTMLSEEPLWRLVGAARWAFVVPALLGGAWTTESVLGRVVVLLGGGAVGAAVALIAGSPSTSATPADLSAALAATGFRARRIEAAAVDARGSVPWLIELDTGRTVFVKTHRSDERIADLLFRTWRMLRLRQPGDERPESSLQRSVEHEAFVAMRAAAVGVRTPRVVTVGRLPSEGAFAAYQAIEGRTFAELGDELTDAQLRSAWSTVQVMQRSGIAHRDLRLANLLVDDDDGEVWLVDFGFAEAVATEEMLRRDLVELLSSTAAAVGHERAVDAGVTVLGPAAWSDALPLVQHLAVSTATRHDLGRKAFEELRSALRQAIQEPEPDLPRLGRIDRVTVLSLLALGAAVWALLPQISQSSDLWENIQGADVRWAALVVVASGVTYLGATLSIRGANAAHLPLGAAFAAQLASSFVNRITPAKVGGIALNIRWMVREGVDTASATAAVGVNALAGTALHLVLTVVAVVWAGSVGFGSIALPDPRTLLVGAGIVLGVLAVTWAVPPLRTMVQHRVVPRLRQSARSVGEVARTPRRLLSLFGGSALVTLGNIAALVLAVRAFGVDLPVASIALVYLAGSAIASAAPTPGGLGATEAVMAAGLIALGVARAEAVAAVLLFRLGTFWLPMLPGWASFTVLQRSGRI